MAKKVLIIILGIAVSALISFSYIAAYLPQAPWAAALCTVLTVLPLALLFFYLLFPEGKVRRFFLCAQEAIIGLYLYLLIVLTLGALPLPVLLALRLPLPPAALYFPALAVVFLAASAAGRLHAGRIRTVRPKLPQSVARNGGHADGKTAAPENAENAGEARADGEQERLHVVFFTDLHLGCFTSPRFLKKLGKTIAAERPDLILFGGDLFDAYYDDLRCRAEALAFFSSLKPRYGFYACPGNHDLYTRGDARAAEFLREAGVRMMNDEAVTLGGRTFFFRKLREEDRLAPEEIPRSSLPLVVIDHRPDDAGRLCGAGASLVLCGHTHNGQTFPGNIVNALMEKYPYGLKTKNGSAVYTTAGAGYFGFPLRLFTANEIVVFDLFFEK